MLLLPVFHFLLGLLLLSYLLPSLILLQSLNQRNRWTKSQEALATDKHQQWGPVPANVLSRELISCMEKIKVAKVITGLDFNIFFQVAPNLTTTIQMNDKILNFLHSCIQEKE